MTLYDFFSSFGSFLSGIIGALVVLIGGLLHIRQRQAEMAVKVENCASDREIQRRRITALEDRMADQKREMMAYVDRVQQHVHTDMAQLRSDMCDRADRSDQAISAQLASINTGLAELRSLIIRIASGKRRTNDMD